MIYLTNEQLRHDHHLDQYRWAMNGNEANDSYFRREATEMHTLLVIDAVSDLLVKAVQVGQAQGGGVHDHLVYGVARRAGDIRLAMREIVQTSPVGRTKPMVSEEVDVVSRALNTIYINIRGSLDNLAWAVIEKNGGLQTAGLNPAEVDLFGRKFRKIEAWKPLTEALADMADWTMELARLRNPAAHQIPLAVVPAAMDENEGAEYQRLHAFLGGRPVAGRLAGRARLAARPDGGAWRKPAHTADDQGRIRHDAGIPSGEPGRVRDGREAEGRNRLSELGE